MKTNLPNNVIDYLQKFVEEKWHIVSVGGNTFDVVVVIPAISEYENIKRLLASLSKNDSKSLSKTLLLFVINNRALVSDEIRNENLLTIEYLKEEMKLRGNDSPENKLLNIAFVDASTQGNELNEKDGGVGYARKIGMDLALSVFNYNSPAKKIIICLDADCIVAANYLKEISNTFNTKNYSAAYVEFEHQIPDSENEAKAIICYEIFLRYYILGLQYSNSRYAFHSIGSTIVCDYEIYIKSGGMNKKKAGEDFYFLEKLSKLTEIKKIIGTKVYPAGRGSWRVPFGTGQRVNRFISKIQNEYLLYDPIIFDILKKWHQVFYSADVRNSDKILNKANEINKSLYSFLVNQKYENDWLRISANCKTEKQLAFQKQIWFDAFRTMKLIHYLRDLEFPTINMFDALDQFFKKLEIDSPQRDKKSVPDTTIQLEYLNILRLHA